MTGLSRIAVSRKFATEARRHAGRVFRFGLVSGAGLCLDLIAFLALIRAGVAPFEANLVSSLAAVTFVYLVSVRRIFSYQGRFHVTMLIAYIFYHLCGITAGSGLVALIAGAGVPPFAAKIAILPLTFGANYLFMGWLTSRRMWSGEKP